MYMLQIYVTFSTLSCKVEVNTSKSKYGLFIPILQLDLMIRINREDFRSFEPRVILFELRCIFRTWPTGPKCLREPHPQVRRIVYK